MKSLEQLSIVSEQDCASQVLETVNLVTRLVRREIRRQRPAEISPSQFRALRILQRHAGLSLSLLAAHMDQTLASASKLIDVLAKHELVERRASPADRRTLALYLTSRGCETLDQAEAATQRVLVALLQAMPAERQEQVRQAMLALQTALSTRDDST